VASRFSAGTGYLLTSPIEIGEHLWQDTVLGDLRALRASNALATRHRGSAARRSQCRVIARPFDSHIVVRPDW